jgi:hypothetical protein
LALNLITKEQEKWRESSIVFNLGQKWTSVATLTHSPLQPLVKVKENHCMRTLLVYRADVAALQRLFSSFYQKLDLNCPANNIVALPIEVYHLKNLQICLLETP